MFQLAKGEHRELKRVCGYPVPKLKKPECFRFKLEVACVMHLRREGKKIPTTMSATEYCRNNYTKEFPSIAQITQSERTGPPIELV